MTRCRNGTRRNKKTGECVEKHLLKKRCCNGTRRNKKTGKCVPAIRDDISLKK